MNLKQFAEHLWDKYHETEWVTGGCGTCQWTEQKLDQAAFDEMILEMGTWIKETYKNE